MKWEEIVIPTTPENRFLPGTVNMPTDYADYLSDCAITHRQQANTIADLRQRLKKPLTWKERITGKRQP